MLKENDTNPLIQVRNELRQDLVKFPLIIEEDPKLWWDNTAKYALKLRRGLKDKPAEIRQYLENYLPTVFDLLRAEAKLGEVPEGIDLSEYNSLRTETRMLELSLLMAQFFDTETETVNENIISLEDLSRRHPCLILV